MGAKDRTKYCNYITVSQLKEKINKKKIDKH